MNNPPGSVLGLGRSHFYRTISVLMRELVVQKNDVEGHGETMVVRVNIQEALSRLRFCPIDGEEFRVFEGDVLSRGCDHGDFNITDVWGDGDVDFKYAMFAPKEEESAPAVEIPPNAG